MKNIKYYLLTFNMLISILSYSQVTNGGFENWAIDPGTSALTPVGWQAPLADGAPAVVQATGHTGSYCAKFVCNPDGFGNYDGGVMQIDNMPMNAIPVSISGFWKVLVGASSSDYFNIWAEVYDASWNVLAGASTNSGLGVSILNWTTFNESFGTLASGTPVNMTISMELPQLVDDQNTYAEIDDLALQFSTGNNDFKNILTAISAQAVPGSDEINIHFSVTRKTDLQFIISDISGRELMQIEKTSFSFGNHSQSVGLNLPAGLYIVKAISSYGTNAIRFVKN